MNNPYKRLRMSAIALASGLVLVNSIVASERVVRSETRDLLRASAETTFPIEVGEGVARLRVDVNVKLSTGTVSWLLIDPQGAERLRGEIAAGSGRGSTGDLETQPGTWRLKIASREASGSYRVQWRVW